MQSHIHRPSQASFSVTGPNGSRKGFTLIELLVVVTIIGILVSVILVASYDGVRTANLKATQALVLKLDLAVKERMQALLDDEVYPNATHIWLATPASNKVGGVSTFGPLRGLSPGRGGNARAKAIAMTDYLRAEMPDVFVLNNQSIMSDYPLNFAGISQAVVGKAPISSPIAAISSYILPTGTALAFDPSNPSSNFGSYFPPDPINPKASINDAYNAAYNFAGTGVFGASYTAVAGIYKQLGYGPAGYDGVDNNSNGLVDEMVEGLPNKVDRDNLISNLRSTHSHKTARSEVLYALLVEGQGPLGAAFSRDDFTDREIQDTDGDGLLEFVDAWGEPLQFYRWPLWYTSDNQLGWSEYPSNPWFTRERDPMDPSNSLVSLDWWAIGSSNNTQQFDPTPSREEVLFEYLFHPLSEPTSRGWDLNNRKNNQTINFWDRINSSCRRAFRFTPLIVSSGPDMKIGTRLWGQNQSLSEEYDSNWNDPTNDKGNLICPVEFIRDIENMGVTLDFYSMADQTLKPSVLNFNPARKINGFTLNQITEAAREEIIIEEIQSTSQDDISSHALQQGLGGGAR